LFSEFMQKLMNGWKGDCPCCGRHSQVYRRTIHTDLAVQLIRMYRLGARGGEFIHASKLIPEGQAGSGDLGKARYFGIVEQMPHVPGKKKKSGYWSLTPDGSAFVRGEIMIDEYAMVFDDRVIKTGGRKVSIQQCLGNGFSYTELMAA